MWGRFWTGGRRMSRCKRTTFSLFRPAWRRVFPSVRWKPQSRRAPGLRFSVDSVRGIQVMSNELLTRTQHWGGVPPIPESAVLQPEFLTDPQSGSLLDYWRAVRRSKKAVAVCSMTGLLLGIGVAFLQRAAYRASSSLEIQDVKNDAGKLLNPAPDTTGVDPLADIQTQIKILQSRTLMENALSKLHIRSERDLTPQAGGAPVWAPLFLSSAAEDKSETVLEKALKSLKV